MKNVAVTGYYGSGSSAVLDLLEEYDVMARLPYGRPRYEHNLFYASGGLFNLCNILTRGNYPFGSDKAIANFKQSAEKSNSIGAAGDLQTLCGDEFVKIVNEFVSEISISFKGSNINHFIGSKVMYYKSFKKLIKCMFTFKKFAPVRKNIFDGEPVYMALPSREEFYEAARIFTKKYMGLFNANKNCEYKVFDHLMFPQQIDDYSMCFEDGLKVIVVERDPRDSYILNKYIYNDMCNWEPRYPVDPVIYAELWQRFFIKAYKTPNVLRVRFEDLVYHYDETVKKIEDFLCIEPSSNHRRFELFNPKRSMENTQLFLLKEEWKPEVMKLEDMLPEYLYKFPYERKPNRELMFDK